ncbi:MAG: hypothetical protein LBE13_09290 [Bacteroidales bacterium]|jgi:hypothetical protein|nr:hypothetical protein [Bacteroidales bacterium]
MNCGKIKKYLRGKYLHENWNIGFINAGVDDVLTSYSWNISWLKHDYHDRFFADPFILEANDENIVVLVEEFYYPDYKGRIAKLTVDRGSFSLIRNDLVLELETHLSFPAIFRHDNKIWLYPENSAAGKLVLYQFDAINSKVIPVSVLSAEPLTDAVITGRFGKTYLFTTKLPDDSGSVLSIYKAEQWNGGFELSQTVEFRGKIARSAGDIFEFDGMIIRPAQDCNKGYGKGLVFQIINQENGNFYFTEYKRFYPVSKKYNNGLHTFNFDENLDIIVVDGYSLPLINKIMMKLYVNR